MQQEILKAIEAVLPQQTAGVLKEYLEKATKWEKELKNANEQILLLKNKEKENGKKIEEIQEELKTANTIISGYKLREASLFKSELEKEIYLLQCQNETKQQIIDRDMAIMNTVFRNPKFIQSESILENKSLALMPGKESYDHGRIEKVFDNKTIEKTQYIE